MTHVCLKIVAMRNFLPFLRQNSLRLLRHNFSPLLRHNPLYVIAIISNVLPKLRTSRTLSPDSVTK